MNMLQVKHVLVPGRRNPDHLRADSVCPSQLGHVGCLGTVAAFLHPHIQTRRHTFLVILFASFFEHRNAHIAHDTEGAKIRLRSRGSPRDPTDTVSAAEQPAHWMRERAPRFWLTARIGCFVTPMKFGKRCESFGPTRNMDFPLANLPPRHHYRSSQTAGAD